MSESMEDYKEELEASISQLDETKIEAMDDEDAELWEELGEQYKNGDELKVKVGGVVKNGVVAYIDSIRAFIPISQISVERVEEKDLDKWLKKTLTVKIITYDRENKRLVLSARALEREKRDKVRAEKMSQIKVGEVLTGKVESLQKYGAFIALDDDVTGLLHISEISHTRIKHPGVVLEVGQEVQVKVLRVEDGKISLSMKALQDNPDAEVEHEHVDLPETEELTTGLGDLLKNIHL